MHGNCNLEAFIENRMCKTSTILDQQKAGVQSLVWGYLKEELCLAYSQSAKSLKKQFGGVYFLTKRHRFYVPIQ